MNQEYPESDEDTVGEGVSVVSRTYIIEVIPVGVESPEQSQKVDDR